MVWLLRDSLSIKPCAQYLESDFYWLTPALALKCMSSGANFFPVNLRIVDAFQRPSVVPFCARSLIPCQLLLSRYIWWRTIVLLGPPQFCPNPVCAPFCSPFSTLSFCFSLCFCAEQSFLFLLSRSGGLGFCGFGRLASPIELKSPKVWV